MAKIADLLISLRADIADFKDAMTTAEGHLGRVRNATEQAHTWMQNFAGGIQRAADIATGADPFLPIADSAEKAEQRVKQAGEGMEGSFKRIGEIAAGVFGGLNLESGVEKVKDFITESTMGGMEWAESLKNQAAATGIAVEKLQVLRYGAQVTGNDLGRLQMVVNKLSSDLLQLRTTGGSKELQGAAGLLGLDPNSFTDAYDALTKIGNRVREIGADSLSLAQRGALAQFLGGRSGMQLIPLIERLAEFEAEMRRTGQFVGGEMIDKLDAGAEAAHKLDLAWEHLKNTLAGVTVGPLTAVFGAIEHVLAPDKVAAFDAALKRIQEGKGSLADIETVKNASAQTLAMSGGMKAGGAGSTEAGPEAVAKVADQTKDAVVGKAKETAAAARSAWADVWEDGSFGKAETAAMDRQLSEQARSVERIAQESARQVEKWNADAARAQKENIAQATRDFGQGMKDIEKQQTDMQSRMVHIFDPIVSALDTTIKGVILGTEKIKTAFSRLGVSIGLEFGSKVVEALGGAAIQEAFAIFFGLQKTAQLRNAEAAASGAYSAYASIPYVGPIIGAAAAAAVFTEAMAFEEGGVVPGPGFPELGGGVPAVVHPGEIIFNPEKNSLGGGGDMHLHFHLIDTSDLKSRVSEIGDHVASVVAERARGLHPAFQPKLGGRRMHLS